MPSFMATPFFVLASTILVFCAGSSAVSLIQAESPGNYWTRRFELTLKRVLEGGPPHYTDDFVLYDAIPRHVRRFTNFSGDVSGRYVDALAASANFSGVEPASLRRVVNRLLSLQKPDGHFGDSLVLSQPGDDDMAMMWGNGRLLTGLLEAYRFRPDPAVLETCRRMGDFLVHAAPVFNSPEVQQKFKERKFAVGYICWTQHIEGLVELYRLTRKEVYLELARAMADRTSREKLQHSHGLLTSCRGILQLYALTGEKRFLAQVESIWDEILQSGNRMVHGAIPEMLDDPVRDEGCSEADWLRLNLTLWELTRQIRYLDEAERVLFNEFAFNQFSTGDFGHYTYSPSRQNRPDDSAPEFTGFGRWSAKAWWCCTLHGLRAFPEIFRRVVRLEDRTLFYDLPVEGALAADGAQVTATSTLEQNGQVSLRVSRVPAGVTLAVRNPEWAESLEVRINGKPGLAQPDGDYLRISQSLEEGDQIDLTYAFKLREHARPATGQVCLSYGPWILGVEELGSPGFFDEPFQQNRVMRVAGTRQLSLHRIAEAAGPLEVPAARFRMDYLPGGYPVQPAFAVLRPIAERTSIEQSPQWEIWFRAED